MTEYGSKLGERFVTPIALARVGATTREATASGTTKVTESEVLVPAKPPENLTYRFKLGGSKTGANAAFTMTLVLGTTTLMTLTADDGSEVDWVAEFTVIFKNSNVQKVMGSLLLNTADPDTDYAAAAVDCGNGLPLFVNVISGHGSDTVTCEMVTVEKGEV